MQEIMSEIMRSIPRDTETTSSTSRHTSTYAPLKSQNHEEGDRKDVSEHGGAKKPLGGEHEVIDDDRPFPKLPPSIRLHKKTQKRKEEQKKKADTRRQQQANKRFAKMVITKVAGPLMHISHKIKHKTFSRLPSLLRAFLLDVKATLEKYRNEAKTASMGRGGLTFNKAELRKTLRDSKDAINMTKRMLPPKEKQQPMAHVGIDMRPPKRQSSAMVPFRVGAQPPKKKSKR